MKKIAILGATGSIGKNTLSVLADMKNAYEIVALSCHNQVAALFALAAIYKPALLCVTDEAAAASVNEVPGGAKLLIGQQSLLECCNAADLVVLGVVGIAGLPVFVHCLQNHIPIALATKEALVYGGQLVRDLMGETGTTVLPLDSEISAIFQCLQGNKIEDVSEIWLTASGGPFRKWNRAQIEEATLADALAHPNWSMGAKISIDSATMANKGLEMIETRYMFDVAPEQIQVVIHPESIVHSMVQYNDGNVMAQLGATDMRLPIAYALAYPHRLPNVGKQLNIFEVGSLHFEKPDYDKFPCLKLAKQALFHGGALQMVYNAANDTAVALFRENKISFVQIPEIIETVMQAFSGAKINSIEEIYTIYGQIERYCRKLQQEVV